MNQCTTGNVESGTGKYSLPPAIKMNDSERNAVLVQVVDTLLKSGLPNMDLTVACGIAGNIDAESSFNYTSVGDNGTSYGLCQWHNTRMDELFKFCKSKGLSPSSVEGQVQFLVQELKTSKKSAYDYITKPEIRTDLNKVASNFCKLFEIPANMDKECPKRAKNAQKVYSVYTTAKGQQTQP